MCCDDYVPGDETDRHLMLVCSECGSEVDREGCCIESCCNWGSEECKKCGWAPCDQSC